MGLRPDMPTVVYSNLIRQTYKHTPIILGGIEASLRRLAHYDYWSNRVRRSVLMDSGADLISYGMGEHSIIQIAEALQSGIPVEEITYIPGTVFKSKELSRVYDPIVLPSFEAVTADKKTYAESFSIAIQILLPHILLQRTTATEDMLSRTLRRFLLRSRKWTMSTIFRIVRHGIRSMIPWAAFLLWKKSNSVSQATVVVLAAVVSVR